MQVKGKIIRTLVSIGRKLFWPAVFPHKTSLTMFLTTGIKIQMVLTTGYSYYEEYKLSALGVK